MRKIEVADLDEGFDESGKPIIGMVCGKTYRISMKNSAVCRRVQWSYRFEDQAGLHEVSLNSEGSSILFKVSNSKHCGNSLEILAHCDGELRCRRSVRIHYRFRFFNRSILEKELNERSISPWKIDQRSTALCGIACIFYLFASDEPDQYQRSVLELHRTGSVLINSYEIRPPSTLYQMNPETDKNYPKGMPYSDWISLASVRSMESRLGYRGSKKEVFSAINWPPMLMRLGRTLLNQERVGFRLFSPLKTYFNDLLFPGKKLNILLNRIESAHAAGAKIIMMIDLNMLYNRADYSLSSLVRYHWIVYGGMLRMEDREGALTVDPRKATMIYFNSYTWGMAPTHSHTSKGISRDAFKNNFYGYIEMTTTQLVENKRSER